MTESEWLASEDPQAMMKWAQGYVNVQSDYRRNVRISSRKWRLLACACCRMLWDTLPNECKDAVEAAEEFAEERYRTADDEMSPVEVRYQQFRRSCAGLGPHNYVWNATVPDAASAASNAVANAHQVGIDRSTQADLLRDIVGNPFRPMTIPTSYLVVDVLSIAETAYGNRRTDGVLDCTTLSVLADALQDLGADPDSDLVSHLRGGGRRTHVRGCWLLDLVLALV